MNYDKLSRSLRYYYEKGIMQKVAGKGVSYGWLSKRLTDRKQRSMQARGTCTSSCATQRRSSRWPWPRTTATP